MLMHPSFRLPYRTSLKVAFHEYRTAIGLGIQSYWFTVHVTMEG